MSSPKKNKTCIYSCPADCGEAAHFSAGYEGLPSLKEDGLEGYDLIYIADIRDQHVFLFGTPKGAQQPPELDPGQPVHAQAHQKAAQGETVSYEWSVRREEQDCFFQSTLLPLRDRQGQVGSVLGLVKNITDWAGQYARANLLKEIGRRTFPQVLLMTREEERRKISSALHDEIGSAAVILTSLLSMVKQSVETDDKKQALKDIAALDQQIKESIERVKNIIVSLRPPNLETVDLDEAVRDLADNVLRYRHIRHTFSFRADDALPVSDAVKIVLYRVAQESLNNILKHAGASEVKVTLHRGVKEVTLTIRDNGKGFDPNSPRSIEHIGLLSMRDSVAYLGGEFTIQSEPGKGTVIEVKCPKVVYGESSL